MMVFHLFSPIFVYPERLTWSKNESTEAVQAEGIAINLHYGCVISGWNWARQYLSDSFMAKHVERVRGTSFNLFLNERYG